MRLLLIEDSLRLQRSLGKGLRQAGYAVDVAGDGVEGLWMARENAYTVVLLDLMLPKLDGLELLRVLRAAGNGTRVLILSARDQVEDRVKGLDLGADDYLVKPFAFEELLARISALARRAFDRPAAALELADLRLDLRAHRLFRTTTESHEEVRLRRREFAVLELLALRRGEVVTRPELLEHVYEFDAEQGSNVIDVLVCALRRKLGAAAALIETRRGQGYVLLLERPA